MFSYAYQFDHVIDLFLGTDNYGYVLGHIGFKTFVDQAILDIRPHGF